MKNKEPPCLEKKCSICCDPVKVARFFPNGKIPVDAHGEKLWIERDELLATASHIDTVKLRSFDCKNFDKATGQCCDYNNRPEICRNTSCIDPNLDKSADEQQAEFAKEKYISISNKGISYGQGKKN
jgi:Fe-S-cluster containining protein